MLLVAETFVCLNVEASIPIKAQPIFECRITTECCRQLPVYRAYTYTHLVVCLTTGPEPLPKRALHIVRSRASSFKRENPLLSLRLYSSFLRILPRLPVTSIPSFISPSVTLCRRQFLRKM